MNAISEPSIDIRNENLFGAGAELGLLIGGGTNNQTYLGELKATRIFNSYLTFGLKVYSLSRDVNVYRGETEAALAEFGKTLQAAASPDADVLLHRVRLLLKADRFSEAIAEFRLALQQFPPYSFFIRGEKVLDRLIAVRPAGSRAAGRKSRC